MKKTASNGSNKKQWIPENLDNTTKIYVFTVQKGYLSRVDGWYCPKTSRVYFIKNNLYSTRKASDNIFDRVYFSVYMSKNPDMSIAMNAFREHYKNLKDRCVSWLSYIDDKIDNINSAEVTK